jgi:hypothetical protein
MKNAAKRTPRTSSQPSGERKTQKSQRSTMRRKNLILNQEKIDRAREIFGVATETEAIDLALDVASDLAQFRAELDTGFKRLLGKGGFTDHFPPLHHE